MVPPVGLTQPPPEEITPPPDIEAPGHIEIGAPPRKLIVSPFFQFESVVTIGCAYSHLLVLTTGGVLYNLKVYSAAVLQGLHIIWDPLYQDLEAT